MADTFTRQHGHFEIFDLEIIVDHLDDAIRSYRSFFVWLSDEFFFFLFLGLKSRQL